ncbi:hypothetical protein FPOA_00447 [Fusarium poae]|uniref:Uncharacterized protein n=1 Tax=Fusarium poae TaxID=36050 RepID=A0A1B8B196_FUSPO|nr:hypothetical protein FPOA_00447 [Fusarium poae]
MNKSRRSRRHLNGPVKANHRTKGYSNQALSDVSSDRLHRIQSWLDATPAAPDELHDSVEDDTQTNNRSRTSSWRPHDLPIASISPNYRRNNRPRDRHTNEERVCKMSQEPFPDDPYPSSHFEASLEAEFDKENKKRSPNDESDRNPFERRPRRKTRPDRYSSKNKEAKKSPAKTKNERSQRKSRPQKHRLRSSQDIMTNFASGAIPNTRVTMKPNLTTGLFLNGRSSAAAPVADLTFNDTRFLEPKTSPKKKHQDVQLNTNGEIDHDEDETPYNLESPQRQHTNCQKTAIIDKDVEGKVNREADHTSQADCNSLNGSNSEPSPETPRTMLKKLIETGIFDGTGILKLTSDKNLQQDPVRDGENGILENVQLVGSRADQHGASTADPSKDSTIPSTTLPQSNTATFYQGHYGNFQNKSADTGCLERHDEKIPLCTRGTTQVCSYYRANPVNTREEHEPSTTQNLTPGLELALDPAVNVTPQILATLYIQQVYRTLQLRARSCQYLAAGNATHTGAKLNAVPYTIERGVPHTRREGIHQCTNPTTAPKLW